MRMHGNMSGPTEEEINWLIKLIARNYKEIYRILLHYEENISFKQPIYIGNKHVYALSDIEGYNIAFLYFLKMLGLVEYQEFKPNNPDGWNKCLSLKKGYSTHNEFPVYYKFNEEACRKFNDVIVLCGDYVRNSRNVSEGTVRILEELRHFLNVGKGAEEKKGLFLLAGNHDIADYSPEKRNYFSHGDNPIDLKARVLNLGLYPQLLLINGDGKRLLFQHTNFPYREQKNYIVNKQIDPQKASKFLENSYTFVADPQYTSKIPMLGDDGFFNLRYIAKQGDLTPKYYGIQDTYYSESLPRELYSDLGIGYDAKFIGHDTVFYGCSMRPDGKGDVYNVNIANQNDPHFVCWRSNRKTSLPLSNVQQNYNKTGNIYMRKNYYAIQNQQDKDRLYKKNLYNLRRNQLQKENLPKYY